jgi:hypothetical protein
MDDVAGVNADPKGDQLLLPETQLDLHRALNRLHGAGEDGQGAVHVVLEDLPVVLVDGAAQEGSVPVPLEMGPLFVLLHEGRVADDVDEHDGRELAGGFFWHGAPIGREYSINIMRHGACQYCREMPDNTFTVSWLVGGLVASIR